MEIWYWLPQDSSTSEDFSGDTLYLHSKIAITSNSPDSIIRAFKIIDGNVQDGYRILTSIEDVGSSQPFKLEVRDFKLDDKCDDILQTIQLPDFFNNKLVTELTIKVNDRFLVVGNNDGFVLVYKWCQQENEYVSHGDSKNLKRNTSLPILRHFNLISTFSESDFLMKTSCCNDRPIFDLNNNWLVYSPTKIEYNQIKIENEDRNSLTPVKLPSSKPLLNKVLISLSNTALDSLFKLSKFSTSKLSQYRNNDKDLNELTINSIKLSINNAVNSTIHSINETTKTFSSNDNQLIKIIDLSNDKVLTVFKSPDGISNLSLSPYDLQLVNSNLRGDSFFIWDLIKLPQEISLIGKFLRGKTSGIIDDIFWFINNNGDDNNVDDLYRGTNSGFGCINEKSGSVHWFNINYLLGNLNNNLPNYLGKEFPLDHEIGHSSKFLDSWILSSSSLKYKRFFKVPNLSNLKSNNLKDLNQLAILDDNNQLKLTSPLNGNNSVRFELPVTQTDPSISLKHSDLKIYDNLVANDLNPVSQIEIETCKPFMNLINFKNINFSTYDFNNEKSEIENFMAIFKQGNQEFPVKDINVSSDVDNDIEGDDFIGDLINDLEIDQNIS